LHVFVQYKQNQAYKNYNWPIQLHNIEDMARLVTDK